jgi:hypothetical protein
MNIRTNENNNNALGSVENANAYNRNCGMNEDVNAGVVIIPPTGIANENA